MSDIYRLLLVEDHTLVRAGLKALLSSQDSFEVVGEAEDGLQAIQKVRELEPDLVLMDLSMPRMSGLDAIREIKQIHRETRILVITVHSTEEHIITALKSGADGYILKRASHSELIMAIQTVLNGQPYLSPEISGQVIQGYLSAQAGPRSALDLLTTREREVMKLIAEGGTNKSTADTLYISVKTVEKHRANLMRKLELHNSRQLVGFARTHGLIGEENPGKAG